MEIRNISGKSVELLSKGIIASMPENEFSTKQAADRYMLCGDKTFTDNAGKFFTCGFAKTVLTPADADKGIYFIAGYDSNNPAKGVLDDIFARAVYIDDNTGRGGVILCCIDAVGMSRHDINDVRKEVIESGKIPTLKSINISCTHSHSAIDTQGLWGEKLFKCGRNEDFMKSLKKKTAEAIIAAYENRRDGKLYYSKTVTEDMQFDCRAPETFDRTLTKIRFEAFDKSEEIQIINFASHAELLGSKTTKISADFPAYMIKEIEANNNNTNTLFLNGAIGGMISAREIRKVYREQIDCEAYTKEFGKALGEIANSLTDETEIEPLINVKSVPIDVEASNFVLILARLLKVLNNDILRKGKRSKAYICSEAGYLELGKKQIGVFLVPGELFPELWNGEFLPPWEASTAKKAEYTPLCTMTDCKHNFVIGLCNDELGYIIPDNDFFLDRNLPYINSGKDIFGKGHYEETNSTGPKTARTILDAIECVIASSKS